MLDIRGKYNSAKVFTDVIEQEAIAQIMLLLNQEFTKDSKVRMMPDVHAGAGCTVGTTMTITDKVVPNLVGVDIGCGMLTIKLNDTNIDFAKLDTVIRKYVPSGRNINEKPLVAEKVKRNRKDYSVQMKIPPLSTMVFKYDYVEPKVEEEEKEAVEKEAPKSKLKIKTNKKDIERSLDKAIEKSKNKARRKKK